MQREKLKNIFTLTQAHLSLIRIQGTIDIILWYYLGIFFSINSYPPLNLWLPCAISFALAFFFANSINDYYDEKIDRENNLSRPLTDGIMNPKQVYYFAVLCALTAVFSALYAKVVIPVIAIILLGIFYSHPKIGWSKKGFLATITMLLAYYVIPFWTGFFLLHTDARITYSPILFFLGILLLALPRLLMKDYRDESGDNKYGKITPLILLGREKLFYLITLITISGTFLFILWSWKFMQGQRLFYVVVTTIMYSSLIFYTTYRMRKKENNECLNYFPQISRLCIILIFCLIIF